MFSANIADFTKDRDSLGKTLLVLGEAKARNWVKLMARIDRRYLITSSIPKLQPDNLD